MWIFDPPFCFALLLCRVCCPLQLKGPGHVAPCCPLLVIRRRGLHRHACHLLKLCAFRERRSRHNFPSSLNAPARRAYFCGRRAVQRKKILVERRPGQILLGASQQRITTSRRNLSNTPDALMRSRPQRKKIQAQLSVIS